MTKPIAVEEYGEWDIEVDGVKYAGKRTLTQAQATTREEEREKWQEYQDTVESIFDWLQGENGDFPDLSQKPHYRFRSQLREMRKTLNNKTDV